MFQSTMYSADRHVAYQELIEQLKALSTGVNDKIAILANASALLNGFYININWVGFYLWQNNELILGPFQGKPACVSIAYGKGVCGTAVATRKTQRIADVHEFPGHIACDEASKSEIVLPIIIKDQVVGVLDIDAPVLDRFDEVDQMQLERFIQTLSAYIE